MHTLPHSVFDHRDAESVAVQHDRFENALADELSIDADHGEAARPDLLMFTASPHQIRRQIEPRFAYLPSLHLLGDPYSRTSGNRSIRRWDNRVAALVGSAKAYEREVDVTPLDYARVARPPPDSLLVVAIVSQIREQVGFCRLP